MANEYKRVEAALASFGKTDKYLETFKASCMDDQALNICISDAAQLGNFITEVIPLTGDRVKFVSAFRKLAAPGLLSSDEETAGRASRAPHADKASETSCRTGDFMSTRLLREQSTSPLASSRSPTPHSDHSLSTDWYRRPTKAQSDICSSSEDDRRLRSKSVPRLVPKYIPRVEPVAYRRNEPEFSTDDEILSAGKSNIRSPALRGALRSNRGQLERSFAVDEDDDANSAVDSGVDTSAATPEPPTPESERTRSTKPGIGLHRTVSCKGPMCSQDHDQNLPRPLTTVSHISKPLPPQRPQYLRVGSREQPNLVRRKSSATSPAGRKPVPGIPVQILGFQPGPTRSHPQKAVFYEERFSKILQKANSRRPVAVLAIAGQANRGKSFFMNYVLRYLNGLRSEASDWFGWNDTISQPLTGFKWANKGETVTAGIWTWSEVFTIKLGNKEIDIILLDTQGIFDEDTGKREWCILAGLSLFVSSCLVLNLPQDLQEDTLLNLKAFLDYSLAAACNSQISREGKPFQHLNFIIRDWKNNHEFPFGWTAGPDFIANKFQVKSEHDQTQRHVRQYVRASFDRIDCCLLPHPGRGISKPQFNGTIRPDTELRGFGIQLENCVEELFKPNRLPVKTLNGNPVAAHHLLDIFKTYTDLLNRDDLSALEAPTSSTPPAQEHNAALVLQCVNSFKETMDRSLTKNPFLDDEDFQGLWKSCENEAVELFQTSSKIGSPDYIGSFRVALLEKISDQLDTFKSKTEKLQQEERDRVYRTVDSIVEAFNNSIECKTEKSYVPHEHLQQLFLTEKINAKESLRALKCPPCMEDEALKTLDKGINLEKWLSKVDEQNQQIKSEMKNTVILATNKYKEQMDPQLYCNIQDFQTAHSKAKQNCLELLSRSKHLRPRDQTPWKRELETMIDKIFHQYLSQLEEKIGQLRQEIAKMEQTNLKNYVTFMDSVIKSTAPLPIEQEKLQKIHENAVKQALDDLAKFSSSVSTAASSHSQPQGIIEAARTNMVKAMESKYTEYETENRSRMDLLGSISRSFIIQAVERYRSQGRKFEPEVVDEEDFYSKSSAAKEDSECWLLQQIKPSNMKPELMIEWKTEVHKAEMDLYKAFDMRQRMEKIILGEIMQELKSDYTREMDTYFKEVSWYKTETLTDMHNRLAKRLLRNVNDSKMELSMRQEKELSDALGVLYLKYEEDNYRRLPTGNVSIGIDLGTTYSCVAFYRDGRVEIIRDAGSSTVPSIVAFEKDRSISVGDFARSYLTQYPEDTIFNAKRLIGRKFDDPTVQKDIELWPFTVLHQDNEPRIQCRGKLYRPEEISAKILYRLKQVAEHRLGVPVTNAVLTIPAYFNDSQRQATKDAAEIAGLKATLLTEPVAAAIAYGLHRTDYTKKNVLVFDLGGGTFDVVIMQMVGKDIKVLSIDGNTHLGGEDFDNLLVQYFIDKVRTTRGIDLMDGSKSKDENIRREINQRLRRIRAECERRKRDLSYPARDEAEIAVEIRIKTGKIEKNEQFVVNLSRANFEKMIHPRVTECISIVARCLEASQLKKAEMHEIVLVGGSSQIPIVRRLLSDFFGGKHLHHLLNPDEAIAQGAAIEAALRNGKDRKIIDVAPMSIGIEKANGEFVVQIPKNSRLPCSHTSRWANSLDYMTTSIYDIYEGESKIAKENHKLGEFKLTGIPPMKKNKAEKDITTTIDEEGIVHVKAVCRTTQKTSDITILTYKGRMSREEILAQKATNLLRW